MHDYILWRGLVKLGTDIHSNITRLDNALDGLVVSLQNCEDSLADTKTQMETAQAKVNHPFPQEKEYKKKYLRLKEINALLNKGVVLYG